MLAPINNTKVAHTLSSIFHYSISIFSIFKILIHIISFLYIIEKSDIAQVFESFVKYDIVNINTGYQEFLSHFYLFGNISSFFSSKFSSWKSYYYLTTKNLIMLTCSRPSKFKLFLKTCHKVSNPTEALTRLYH